MASAYPSTFPVNEGLEIVSILRSGNIVAKKAKLGYNIWLLQGYAQLSLLGDPNDVTPMAVGKTEMHAEVPANFDAVNELEKVCKAHQSGAMQAQIAVPWQAILQWAFTQILPLLIKA